MQEQNLFVARQPIFDAKGRVWGYELLYRQTEGAETADIGDLDESTLKVAASLLVSPDNGFQGAYCVVNCSRNFLLQGYARGLLSDCLVLSLSQDMAQDQSLSLELSQLTAGGAKLALTVSGHDAPPPVDVVHAFHILEVPVHLLQEVSISRLLQQRAPEATRLLVSRIETEEEAELALQKGADFYQGFHYQRPRTFSVRPLPASLLNRLKILQMLESEVENTVLLSEAVEADASISMRLLQFINSAMFCFIRRIESVHQAMALMGWKRLKNWLRLLVVTDLPASTKTCELACNAAVRAKFLELLALYSGNSQLADRLYMTGLFSLLEAMLEQPFKTILDALRLQDDVHDALLGHGGPLLPWLELARELESGNWLKLDARREALGLDLNVISKSKLEALGWANEFFSALR